MYKQTFLRASINLIDSAVVRIELFAALNNSQKLDSFELIILEDTTSLAITLVERPELAEVVDLATLGRFLDL